MSARKLWIEDNTNNSENKDNNRSNTFAISGILIWRILLNSFK